MLAFGFVAMGMVGADTHLDAVVTEYGRLQTTIGDKSNEIESLSVTGPIDESDFKTIWNCAYYGKLSSVDLSKAAIKDNKIPDNALYNFDLQFDQQLYYLPIKKIVLPEGITEFGEYAFCFMLLEDINIPSTLKKIGVSCFGYCFALKGDPLVLPEGLETIDGHAFRDCWRGLKGLVLPSTLRSIGEFAFYNTDIKHIQFSEGLESIGQFCFTSSSYEELILPNSCQDIGNGACSWNQLYLTEIHIPEGLKTIPTEFANNCPNLEKVNIPSTIENIDFKAFKDCKSLKSIDLPEGLKNIWHNSFWNCGFETVVFPSSLQGISGETCLYWPNVKAIYFKSDIPPISLENDTPDFSNGTHPYTTPKSTPIYVPVGAAQRYREALPLKYFTNFIETNHFPGSAGVEQIENTTDNVEVFKNGQILVIESNTTTTYTVYSIDGRTVAKGRLNGNRIQISLPAGIYIIKTSATTTKLRM